MFSNFNSVKKILFRTLAIIFCALSVCGFYEIFTPHNRNEFDKDEKDLITISSKLSNPPLKYITKGKNQTDVFRLTLIGYAPVYFENKGIFLEATDWITFKNEVNLEDSITIKVDRKEFERYYLKRDSLSFLEAMNHPNNSYNFYSLKYKNKEYITNLYEAAEKNRHERKFGYCIFLSFLFGVGVYTYFNSTK